MESFTVSLANVPIGISALYKKTREAYREYLTSKTPFFSLVATEQELTALNNELIRQGVIYTRSAMQLEEQWFYRQIAERLPEYGAMLFHGSAVAVDGAAYLFTAPSGIGKSTHTRLWRQHFGDKAVMINDDKPLLRFDGNNVSVCGSPWRGKHRLGTNTIAPLKGLCLLTRDVSNSIVPVSAAEAFPALLKQCYRPESPQRAAQTLALLDRLTQNAAVYRLRCNMEPDAAQVAYSGMNGG